MLVELTEKELKVIKEAYDAVTDRNNIKKQRQANRSYLTYVMKRLKNALEEKGIDCTVKDYTALKIGKYKVTLWNDTEEFADVKEHDKNYEGAESGDDASYSQMENNVILRFWDTTHLSPDEKVFDVRNTPGMVKWILDNIEG